MQDLVSKIDQILEEKSEMNEKEKFSKEKFSNKVSSFFLNYNPFTGLLPSWYLEKKRLKKSLFNSKMSVLRSSILFGLSAYIIFRNFDSGIELTYPLMTIENIGGYMSSQNYEHTTYNTIFTLSKESVRFFSYYFMGDSAYRAIITTAWKPVGTFILEAPSAVFNIVYKGLRSRRQEI